MIESDAVDELEDEKLPDVLDETVVEPATDDNGESAWDPGSNLLADAMDVKAADSEEVVERAVDVVASDNAVLSPEG